LFQLKPFKPILAQKKLLKKYKFKSGHGCSCLYFQLLGRSRTGGTHLDAIPEKKISTNKPGTVVHVWIPSMQGT
jgi:hypothetical protein